MSAQLATGATPTAGAAYIYDVTTGAQLRKLIATDGADRDFFGGAVAIDGNIAVVGAEANAGVVPGGGAAYVFNVTTGQQLFKLTPTDAAQNEFFGVSVAVSGNRAIIGAYDDHGAQGSAYIFDLSTGQQLFKLTASDAAVSDFFGISVAAKGNLAIIGADQKLNGGTAYVFNIATGQQLAELLPNDGVKRDDFGIAVGISGNLAVVGAQEKADVGDLSGAAYVFNSSTGEQITKLTGTDTAQTTASGRPSQ